MDIGLALPTVLLFLIRMLYEIQPQGHDAGSMRNTLFGVKLNLSFSKAGLALAASQYPYKTGRHEGLSPSHGCGLCLLSPPPKCLEHGSSAEQALRSCSR